ncbi:hypothetical protein NEAUS04_0198 [Nematocida ausubeli]|uniref:Uncharacterized protein n=1 Tax=Nematocida ausubeli (strain ATCC PRA-371 / ERTm2) TaxID=1913371 RepID=A0A086IYY3_NEMA1|nr:uncharacterized protein NESG_02423 [Nematocida ausubeli]KAI5133577.1 hypothetical protein NEAUS07_0471 [Nematocida ausubeli]KAI5147171.1 hypothetical protein NEAUS05_0493 [Nematocida ausubeli]KAI5160865.1 hypothetical protein NEAUS04_0198 [Nematocida ausubeli]KFG25101.1 hypothetical protein NESG_02423 [Nematocida ausubeli]
MKQAYKMQNMQKIMFLVVAISMLWACGVLGKPIDPSKKLIVATETPKEAGTFLWLALCKFVKLMAIICESIVSYNIILLALVANGGKLHVLIWLMQMFTHGYYCVNYKENYDVLCKAHEKEKNTIYDIETADGNNNEEISVYEQYWLLVRDKGCPYIHYNPEDYFKDGKILVDLKEEKAKAKLNESKWIVVLRRSTYTLMQFIFSLSLFKSMIFVLISTAILLDMFVLNYTITRCINECDYLGPSLLSGMKQAVMCLHGPVGTTLVACLAFFGETIGQYYKISELEESDKKKDRLYKKNRLTMSYFFFKGILLSIIIFFKVYSLVAFVDQVVWAILSPKVGDWLIEKSVKGVTPNELRKKLRSKAKYEDEEFYSKIIQIGGVAVSVFFLFYVLAALFGIPPMSSFLSIAPIDPVLVNEMALVAKNTGIKDKVAAYVYSRSAV